MTRKTTVFLSFLLGTLVVTLFSCIPARKYDELKAKYKITSDSLNACRTFSKSAETQINEQKAKILQLEKQMFGLEKDTSIIGTNYRNLTSKYDKLNQINEQLLNQLSKLTQNANNENTKL